MSSTRYVELGERRRQNGWASSPEFDVLRGINGTAVAFKAALLDDPKRRELLYFLQAMSLREGGLKRIAREIVEMFPERIGTPTMLKIGCKPGKRLTRAQYDAIHDEVYPGDRYTYFAGSLLGNDYDEAQRQPAKPLPVDPSAAESFCNECVESSRKLDAFIEELCCNPKMEVACASERQPNYSRIVDIVIEDVRAALNENPKLRKNRPDLETATKKGGYQHAELQYFHDILGALFEYKRRQEESARASFVETSIGKIVFEAIDYALETGKSALVEGNAGFGKTTALKAKCDMHLGQVRYVQLTGITSRTTFFRKLAKAFGVAGGNGFSSAKIQARVEEFLQRTKLMLVIDEGQYLWPQGKRIESHPELINWLNTACYNEGVPFVIAATKQFTLRRQHIERHTDWSSEQSRRRTRRTFPLPDLPTKDDLKAVARKLLGDLGESAVEYVVGYALTSRGYFQSITDAIDDARLIAKRDGRERIAFRDLKNAVNEWRAPSDAALQRVFDSKPEGRQRRRQTLPDRVFETADNESLRGDLSPVADRFAGSPGAARTVRPELVTAGTG